MVERSAQRGITVISPIVKKENAAPCGVGCLYDGGGFITSPGLWSQYGLQQQVSSDWSLSWQINASAAFLGQELLGVWDVTGGALITAVAHPVSTAKGLASLGDALADPFGHLDTWMALGQAGQQWFSGLSSGDGRKFGQLVGTVGTIFAGGPAPVLRQRVPQSLQKRPKLFPKELELIRFIKEWIRPEISDILEKR